MQSSLKSTFKITRISSARIFTICKELRYWIKMKLNLFNLRTTKIVKLSNHSLHSLIKMKRGKCQSRHPKYTKNIRTWFRIKDIGKTLLIMDRGTSKGHAQGKTSRTKTGTPEITMSNIYRICMRCTTIKWCNFTILIIIQIQTSPLLSWIRTQTFHLLLWIRTQTFHLLLWISLRFYLELRLLGQIPLCLLPTPRTSKILTCLHQTATNSPKIREIIGTWKDDS